MSFRPSLTKQPDYWMFESSGVLRPVIEAYLIGAEMSPHDIAVMRAYLRQWIMAPVWRGPDIEQLRSGLENLTCRAAFETWLASADAIGIDPL